MKECLQREVRLIMTKNDYIIVCVILAFFPWVSFNLNSYDTQPWFLVASFPVLAIVLKKKYPFENLILLFFFFSILVLILDAHSDLPHAARGIGTYASLCLSILVFNRYIEVSPKKRARILVALNLVWFLYSIFQIFGIDKYLNFVAYRTSETRGYTSLATEPTFFGIYLLFQMLIIDRERKIYLRFYGRENRWLKIVWWLSLIQIFFIAKSSMAILLFLVIYAAWLAIYRLKLSLFVFVLLGILTPAFLIPSLVNSEHSSRPAIIFAKVLADPGNILLLDQSVNERAASIYISIDSAISDFLIPHGTLQFNNVSANYHAESDWITKGFDNKIMSFIGALLFETGFISLFFFSYVLKVIKPAPAFRDKIFWIFTFFVIYITAIPVGFPLTGYLFAATTKSYQINPVTSRKG